MLSRLASFVESSPGTVNSAECLLLLSKVAINRC